MSVKTPLPEIFRQHSPEGMKPEPTGEKPVLKKLPGIRSVLFDVYGTLFQSGVGDISLAEEDRGAKREKLIRASMKDAGLQMLDQKTPVAELFHDTIRAEQDIRREQGVDFPEVDILGVWEDLIGQLEAYELIRGRASRAALRTVSVLYEANVNPAAPMPGAVEAIEGLLDKQKSLGIISNAQFYTPLLFEAFLEGSPHDLGFEEILCIWSFEHTVAKPSPKLFEVAAERLQALDGIAPGETLFIGNDMRNDIAPAAKLGFKTALFAGDKRSLRLRKDDESCKGVKPDLVITELEQLLECV
ncbi:HAD family hydrolase [Ruficoccus amylovorans]|uniref:HAD family hydrolase n=1 Tax=Ruficoccus amylovorans TaxID=1804625 RepID=A0A842HEB0_9BACT|nr:HAD family hydrolase [Ruficoccus amylovorans]MBC2593996.1 HAD family hydrolase [Ruficoccus amylovorans]